MIEIKQLSLILKFFLTAHLHLAIQMTHVLNGHFKNWCLSLKKYGWLTLFRPGGGHYGPHYHESVCRCRKVRTKLSKLPDFVPLDVCQVQESQFWCLFFKKLKNIDVKNFWGSSSIRKIGKF